MAGPVPLSAPDQAAATEDTQRTDIEHADHHVTGNLDRILRRDRKRGGQIIAAATTATATGGNSHAGAQSQKSE